MSVEQFVVTKWGNPNLRNRVNGIHRERLAMGEPISKIGIMAEMLVDVGRNELLALHEGTWRGVGGTSIAREEEQEYARKNAYSAVFMGELVLAQERIAQGSYSTLDFVTRVNKQVEGAGVPPLPDPSLDRVLNQNNWKRAVDAKTREQNFVHLIKDASNFPWGLENYITTNELPRILFEHMNQSALQSDFETLVQTIAFSDVNLGDAVSYQDRAFTDTLREQVAALLEGRLTPNSEHDGAEVPGEESDNRSSRDVAEELLAGIPGINGEAGKRWRRGERRAMKRLWRQEQEENRRKNEPITDENKDEVVEAGVKIIGDGKKIRVLDSVEMRKLDSGLLKGLLRPDTDQASIPVAVVYKGTTSEEEATELQELKDPYFDVVHEETVDADLVRVNEAKRNLIGHVATRLVQTGSQSWQFELETILNKDRVIRPSLTVKKKEEEATVQQPVTEEVTAEAADSALGLNQVEAVNEALSLLGHTPNPEVLPTEPRSERQQRLGEMVTRSEDQEAVREWEWNEKIHLGFSDGQELYYWEPMSQQKKEEFLENMRRRVVNEREEVFKKESQLRGDDLPSTAAGVGELVTDVLRKAGVSASSVDNPNDSGGYADVIRKLLNSDKLWKDCIEGDDLSLSDVVDGLFFRNGLLEAVKRGLEEIGKGDEFEMIIDQELRLKPGELRRRRVYYRRLYEKLQADTKLLRLIPSEPDQFDRAIEGAAKRAEGLAEGKKTDEQVY